MFPGRCVGRRPLGCFVAELGLVLLSVFLGRCQLPPCGRCLLDGTEVGLGPVPLPVFLGRPRKTSGPLRRC